MERRLALHSSKEGVRPALLILTQKVDRDDPVLGFFHGWLVEFARRFERITVVCLEEGVHSLPKNVEVLSLGKSTQGGPQPKADEPRVQASGWERGLLRLHYVLRFYRYL